LNVGHQIDQGKIFLAQTACTYVRILSCPNLKVKQSRQPVDTTKNRQDSKSNQPKVLPKYTGEALKDEVSKCLPFQHHIHTDRQNERTTRSGLPNAILM
jgi:hypothetical protein